jgi:hypothetical protein
MFTGNGCGGSQHCDSAALEHAISRHQAGDPNAMSEVVALSEQRILALIRHYNTARYCNCDERELISSVHCKLLRAVERFDPNRASAFTFLSCLIQNELKTAVTRQRKHEARYCEFSDELASQLITNGEAESRAVLDDLADRVRCEARTMLSDQIEIDAQRWLVLSFCQEGFAYRRFRCADDCMSVFRLSYARSREIYDLTMLETRRALYDHVKRQREQITPAQLCGSRAHWMTQYSPLLSADEFTKFAVLMRNLAPYLLLLIVDPTRINNHRRDRNPTIGRQTLELILNGHPGARALFQ